MDNNNTNNNANSHASENAFAILVILAAFYHKYRPVIEQFRQDLMERLQSPFFILFLVSLAILLWAIYYSIGHHVEKFMNIYNMWRRGIKPDDKEKSISFPFIALACKNNLTAFLKIKIMLIELLSVLMRKRRTGKWSVFLIYKEASICRF